MSIFVIKHDNNEYYAYYTSNIKEDNYYHVSIEEIGQWNSKYTTLCFSNYNEADLFMTKHPEIKGIIEEIVDVDDCNGLSSYFYVKNLEKVIREKFGQSLKENYDEFCKEQNKGKFLFSDLKEIINSMSEEELDKPVNIEVMGNNCYEQINIIFSNGRDMNISGKLFKATSDCFKVNVDDINLTYY